MKKILAVLVIIGLSFALASCGDEDDALALLDDGVLTVSDLYNGADQAGATSHWAGLTISGPGGVLIPEADVRLAVYEDGTAQLWLVDYSGIVTDYTWEEIEDEIVFTTCAAPLLVCVEESFTLTAFTVDDETGAFTATMDDGSGETEIVGILEDGDLDAWWSANYGD